VRDKRMSKWLVTLEYEYERDNKTRKNKFVEFESKYPTEEEIRELIKKNVKIVKYTFGNAENDYSCEGEIYPTIIFMQRLEEVQE